MQLISLNRHWDIILAGFALHVSYGVFSVSVVLLINLLYGIHSHM